MAFVSLEFPFGSTLTASKMGAMQDNFTAFAGRETGTPDIIGGADKMCVFSSNGHIFQSRGVTSITHGATGQYIFNMSSTFSVGTQVESGGSFFRSVPTTLSGFTSNVAYSDSSVRVLRGTNAVVTNSGTYPMGFRAGNSSSTANEDVYQGCVVWLEKTET